MNTIYVISGIYSQYNTYKNLLHPIDGLTPAVLVQEYYERLAAPKKEIFILQGVGHLPMEEVGHIEIFAETLKKALAIVLE